LQIIGAGRTPVPGAGSQWRTTIRQIIVDWRTPVPGAGAQPIDSVRVAALAGVVAMPARHRPVARVARRFTVRFFMVVLSLSSSVDSLV
jgi:hypothetical protein